MDFFKKLFAPAPPRDDNADLEALNAKIAAHPENADYYDQRAGILFRLGDSTAALADFEKATSFETDKELLELRAMELAELKKKYRV